MDQGEWRRCLTRGRSGLVREGGVLILGAGMGGVIGWLIGTTAPLWPLFLFVGMFIVGAVLLALRERDREGEATLDDVAQRTMMAPRSAEAEWLGG